MTLKAYISNFLSVIAHGRKKKKIQNKVSPPKKALPNVSFCLGNMALSQIIKGTQDALSEAASPVCTPACGCVVEGLFCFLFTFFRP